MPVTLKLSDEEARDLAEMLSTAATVAASNQQDGAEARLAAWGNLVSRLMKELSVTSKLKGRIAYADELGGYAFTREYEESAFSRIAWMNTGTTLLGGSRDAYGGQGHQRTPGAGIF